MSNKRKEFSKVYDQYIKKIYRFIFVKVESQEVAQDLCSETFLKCWEYYKDNPAKIENISAFLYRVARNLVTDHYRARGKAQIVSPEFVAIADPEPGLEEKAIFNSDLNNVKVSLASLKDEYQNAIVWYYIDDLPIKEVAGLMNKTEDAARVTIHRALKALKGKIEHREA